MTSAHDRSMTLDQLNAFLQLRGLENYKTNYVNPKLPVLSFTYAIYAGGEHTLYCDFSMDYLYTYLFKHFDGVTPELFQQGGAALINKLPAYVRPLLETLNSLYTRSKDRTVMVDPTAADLDVLLAAVKVELLSQGKPNPVW